MLSPYRVLDLTDEKGLLCGKILGDMGADVIKVERPGGDPSRRFGPFFHDDPHPEKSLFWLAYNTSKKGITLNLESTSGQEIFKKLAAKADFVIESFSPGFMSSLGLGYEELAALNPKIIVVSITPFGQSGPHRDYKTSDIVAWALGGEMAPYGDADRAPTRFSHHSQAFLHAGSDGAQGALTALYQRWQTGEGDHIDVSIQDSVIQCLEHHIANWDLRHALAKRDEKFRMGATHTTTLLWPCKDGWVSWSHGGNSVLAPSLPLVKWMQVEGASNEFLDTFNWDRPDFPKIFQEEMDKIEEPTARFFLTHSKAELLEGAVKYKVMMYPVATPNDMLENRQLAARKFWVELEHSDLGSKLAYPGPFAVFSESPINITRRAPLIGEHNAEIYEGQLGMTRSEIVTLRQAGII